MRPARNWLFDSLWACHLLYGMVLASRVFLVGQPGCCDPGSDEYICGRQALLSAYRCLGAEPKSAQGAPLREGGGSDDLQSLCGLADRAGFRTAVVKIPLTELAQLGTPCIAYLWNGHFAAVSPLNGGPPSFVHMAEVPRTLAADEVASLYSGFALLIAKDASAFPAPRAEGPDLRLDTYAWDFGAVNQDVPVERIVKLRNVGNADLAVSKVETSCGDCLVPIGGPQTIAPGREGEMKAMVTTANQRRGVSKELRIHSNDPISPVVHLAVTGYVRPSQLAFSPRGVNLGSPRRADKVSSEVYVPSFEEDRIEVTSLSSSSPYVTAELSESKHKERPGYIVTATLKPGAPLGEFRGSIIVVSNHWKQPKVDIPVTATIRGSIDLSRDSFFLGIVKKGSRKQCAVTISAVSDKPLTIDKIDNLLPYLSVDAKPNVEGKEYILTATLKPDAPLGNIKGMLTIHTNDPDQPEIKVPVYAYV